jgi:mannose-6-phosphate isomerase-like protein (cupin superfamily)
MEAPFEETEHGLVCKGEGWFLVNAREVRWRESKGRGVSSNFGGDTLFDQLGVGITVVGPNEPTTSYHWESDEEDFLVLRGGGIAILDGEEHELRQWDAIHCPPGVVHAFVGGPDGLVLFGVGARERHTMVNERGERVGKPGESGYVANPVAARYGAAPEHDTEDPREAYKGFPPREPVRYGGWLD